MRKLFIALLCVAASSLFAAPKFDFGDKFAFAGLESSKLVPPSGKEILERKIPVRNMDQRPIRDAVYIYTGDTKDAITVEELNAYIAQVYEAAKAASNDGKVYKEPSYGDTKLVGELTEPAVTTYRSYTFKCIFKHGDKWYSIHAGHGADYGGTVWVKDLPEKFFCYTIYVKEYFIDE